MERVHYPEFNKHVDLMQCPKCSNISLGNAQALFLHKWKDPSGIQECTVRHAFCVCTKCNEVWYRRHDDEKFMDEPLESFHVYPPFYGRPIEPEAEKQVWYAVRALKDATACFNIGLYDPAVLLCRRAVELYLHEVFPGNKKLSEKIEQAQANGKITGAQKEFFHFLRETGNVAAHATRYVFSPEEAGDILQTTYEAINSDYRHQRIRQNIQGR